MKRSLPVLLLWLLSLVAGASEPSYVKMNDDLAELKSDFNAAADQLRLVYIVGPT